ncbi:hypothetical protein D2E26_0530 [Bifidobacterium dolichotidis]|uniref:Uncharacterized protein n=1 Tax=Bifidobacterium dolichotidis TaxID=2306976 RepID=A0A430FT21_9BIFI|nr:hypothetical protein [Bifidobacterium dolichotidis]RSX55967.1 hypothetical protein D2E26_0530 [Bifidobacterium dolichotidis]
MNQSDDKRTYTESTAMPEATQQALQEVAAMKNEPDTHSSYSSAEEMLDAIQHNSNSASNQ